jgi:glycosyltransferase involved in cell wall biosynthesis
VNIWILNHYADTPGRQSTRTYDLSKALVDRGHQVTVFAAGFNHTSLKEERIREDQTSCEESCNGVRFIWLKTRPYRGNDIARVLNMIEYSWRAFWMGCRLGVKPDAIIGVSVHPLAAVAAWALSLVRKSRFFFELTDLWPQVLVDFGMLSPRNPITFVLRAWEKFLYRRAERIIMIWPRTEEYLAQFGIPPEKIVWIPHVADFNRYLDLRNYDGKVRGPFTVVYMGTFVNFMAMEVILYAARELETRGRNDIRFLLVGGGTQGDRLLQMSKSLGLRNLEFFGIVPKEEISRVMAQADAFIVSLKNVPLLRFGISLNKTCDYLASGRPTILAGNPGFDPVREGRAGISVPPEDPRALADAIEILVSMAPEERVQMGRNGLNYLKMYHDVEALADRLERVLLSPSDPREVRSSDVLRSEFKSSERPSV